MPGRAYWPDSSVEAVNALSWSNTASAITDSLSGLKQQVDQLTTATLPPLPSLPSLDDLTQRWFPSSDQVSQPQSGQSAGGSFATVPDAAPGPLQRALKPLQDLTAGWGSSAIPAAGVYPDAGGVVQTRQPAPSGAATAQSAAMPTTQPDSGQPAATAAAALPPRMDTSSRDANLQQWAPALQDVERRTGLRADAMAAIIQAENGGGQSPLSAQDNNYFSITAVPGRPYQAGVGTGGRFAHYNSPQDSLNDFVDLIQKHYPEAWANRSDPQKFFAGLVKGGYIVPEPGFPVETWLTNLETGRQHFNQLAPAAAPPPANIPGPDLSPNGTPITAPAAKRGPYSGTYTQQSLANAGDPDAWAKCGPVAALQASALLGGNLDPATVERLAKQRGWTASAGMAGLQSEAGLLNDMNIAARAEQGPVDWQRVIADVQRGNPVILQLPGHEGHYVTAQAYDPQTGRIDFGSTVGDLRAAGHKTQFTPQELEGLGWGSPNGALYLDNPATPAPSVVAGNSGASSITPPRPDVSDAAASVTAPTVAPMTDRMATTSGQPTMYRQPLGIQPPGDTRQASDRDPREPLPPWPPVNTPGQPYDTGDVMHPAPSYPMDTRPPGAQPGDVTDDEGVDRSLDPLLPPWQDHPPFVTNPYAVPPGTMYRQPLGSATAGPDTFPTDQQPPAAQTIPQEDPTAIPRPAYVAPAEPIMATPPPPEPGLAPPSSPYDPQQAASMEPAPDRFSTPSESPLKPVWDAGGRVIGYVHAGLDAVDRSINAPVAPPGSPQARALQTVGINPDAIPAGGPFGAAERTVRDLPAHLASLPAANQQAVTETSDAIVQSSRATGQDIQQGNVLAAVGDGLMTGLNAANALYAPLARDVDHLLPDFGVGPLGAGDIALNTSVPHDVVNLARSAGQLVANGVKATPKVLAALRNGVSVDDILQRAAGAVDRGVEAAQLSRALVSDLNTAEPAGQALHGVFGVAPPEAGPAAEAVARPRFVPPDVRERTTPNVELPDDPRFQQAVENTGGQVTDRGIEVYVTRAQGEAAAGQTATRGGVFVEPVRPGGRSSYVTSSDNPNAVGGAVVLPPTKTLYRKPLVIDEAPGSRWGFQQVAEQLNIRGPVNPDTIAQAEHNLRNIDAFPQSYISSYGSLEEARRVGQQMLEDARAGRVFSADIDTGISAARAAGPEGSPQRAQALKDLVSRYGGDPALIDDLLKIRGADASESAWAIKENIVAANARRQGYDGVFTMEDTGEPNWKAINQHPLVVKANEDFKAAATAQHEAAVAHQNAPTAANWQAYQQATDTYQTALDAHAAAQQEAERLIGTAKLTEIFDVQQGRNPTPGPENPRLAAAEAAQTKSLEEWDRLMEEMRPARQRAYERDPNVNGEDPDVWMRRQPELQPFLERHDAAYAETGRTAREVHAARQEGRYLPGQPGYSLHPDVIPPSQGAAATAGITPVPVRSHTDVLASVNKALSQGVASAVSGGVGAATNQQLNPDDPNAALKGFAVGAVAPYALSRGARALAGRAAGRTEGALATLGHVPPGGEIRAPTIGAGTTAFGANPGERVQFRFRVVPLEDLVTSHTNSLGINPDFPRELQPRIRDRAASGQQINSIMQRFDPGQMLVDTHTVDRGPMIVGPDNVVESGNGRSIALRRLAQEKPAEYQRYVDELRGSLPDYGLAPAALEGIDHPVLVRERVSDVNRAEFAAGANVSAAAEMAPIERAMQDAGRLTDEHVTRLTVGDGQSIDQALLSPDNRDVVRAFVGAVPESERGALLDASGNLNAYGLERLKSALLAKTYTGEAGARIATAFVESTDPGVRNVENAVYASLPAVARSEALVASGERDASLSVAPDVATAIDVYARLKRAGMSVGDYLAQGALFGERETTPVQDQILQYLNDNARSPRRIRDMLEGYAQAVDQQASPDQVGMFGEASRATKEEVLNGITRELGAAPADTGADVGRVGAGGEELAGATQGPSAAPEPSTGAPALPAADESRQRFERAQAAARAPVSQPRTPASEIIPATGGPEGTLRQPGAPRLPVPQGAGALLPTRDFGSTSEVVDHVLRQEQQQARALSTRAARPSADQAALPAMAQPSSLLQRIRDAVAPWERRLDIGRYAGMLSDSASHTYNAVSNTVLQAADVAATPLAAGIDVGRSALTGTPRQVFFAEVPARLAGMRAGARVGLENAAEILRTGLRPEDAAKQMDRSRAGFGTNIPGIAPAGGPAAGAVDFAFEAPLRALAASDAVFRTMAQGGHLAAEATAAAMKANGGNAVAPNVLREAMKDPGVIERAGKLAARTVLQEDRKLTTWYRRALTSADPVTRALVSVEIPFARTPYNVVAQGVGLTPVGLLGVIQDMAEHKPARAIEYRVARVALGTAVMAGAAADYASGNLTGPRPTDPKELSTLPPGWQPWSQKIPLPNGETYYLPLALLGPFAVPPVAAILAGESIKQGKQAFSLDQAASIALGVGQYASQNTFFQALSHIGGLLDPRDASRNIERNVEQVVAQFSPHIVGGGGLGREIQRIMGMPLRDPQNALEALLATHPATAGQVAPRQDVLGRPSTPSASGPLAAVVRAGREQDVGVIRAFRKAGEGLPLVPPKQLSDPELGTKKHLTVPQQKRWQRVFGQALGEGWRNEGNPTDAETLRRVEGDAREAANQTVLGLR